MKSKNIVFILALSMILLCCLSAVSASEDVDDNAVSEVVGEVDSNDGSLSDYDDSAKESLEISEQADDVDDSDSALAAGETDILSQNDLSIYINDEDDIRAENGDDVVVQVINGDNRQALGTLSVTADGKNIYQKSISVPKESFFTLTAADLKNLPLGQSLLHVSFLSEGSLYYNELPINVIYDFRIYYNYGDSWELFEGDLYEEEEALCGYNDEDTQIKVVVSNKLNGRVTYVLDGMANTVNLNNGVAYFTISTKSMDLGVYSLAVRCSPTGHEERQRDFQLIMEPYFFYFNLVQPNKEFPIEVILPKMYSGSFRIYEYDPDTEEVGSIVKQTNVVNGRGVITMNKLSQGYYYYYLVFESNSGHAPYAEDIEIVVKDNNPNIKVNVPSQVTVGSSVTVSANGPYGTYDVYVDGLYKHTFSSVTSFNYAVSNLAVGNHVIHVLYDYEGDFQYNGAFNVNVKAKSSTPATPAKPAAIKLTLKKAKIKKSKKLTLSATLKQGSKALKGKKVSFKLNGKTYKAKTNAKGVAKVTIKKSALKKLKVGKKVTVKASYGSASSKFSVKVKK